MRYWSLRSDLRINDGYGIIGVDENLVYDYGSSVDCCVVIIEYDVYVNNF